MFITIEGIEGVGKTTLIQGLQKYFAREKLDVLITREPGGTVVSEKIRNIILDSNVILNDKTECLLFFAARLDHIEKKIKPAIKQGKIVICDRYIEATYAYQGGGRGLSIDYIDNLVSMNEILLPDLTLLLNANIKTSHIRLAKRNTPKDRIELLNDDFFNKVQKM